MKNEVGSDHPELGIAVPFLDTAVWIENANHNYPNGKIMHKFYEKDTKAQQVIHKDSDINERAKRTIHTQEIIRILRNNSKDLPDEVKDLGIDNYAKKLKYSGYDKNFAYEIIKSGHNGYNKQLKADEDKITPLYRPREWNRELRNKEKKEKVGIWFKNGGFDFKLLIPSTPNGELKKLIEENTDFVNSKLKTKLIEESGTPLVNVLQKYASTKTRYPCEDFKNCLQCRTGDVGKCRISHITYELICLEPGCLYFYFGETNRNGYSRGCEHLKDSLSKSLDTVEKSVIENHSWQITLVNVIKEFKSK